MYIVLGVLYESYIHPVTILSTLPSAGIGATLALMLCGMELGVVGIIGIILLIGIVKKNAIMMIDFALEAEAAGGQGSAGRHRQACLLRLRPILMTTMAALLGALQADDRLGHGRGTAPSAGRDHGGRPHRRQPGADPVHRALISVVRASGREAGPPWRGGRSCARPEETPRAARIRPGEPATPMKGRIWLWPGNSAQALRAGIHPPEPLQRPSSAGPWPPRC